MTSHPTGFTIRTRVVLGLLWMGSALAACSGDDGDPDPGSSSSSSSSSGNVPEGGGSSSSSGSSSGSSGGPIDASSDAADAAAVEAHGIFFTEQHYAANFAAASASDQRNAFADGLCQAAAVEGGLAGRYQAVLAVTAPDGLPSRFQPGAWCAIQNGAPDCTGDHVIFEDAVAFLVTPRHVLTTDQRGNATNPSMKFLSGLSTGPDDGYSLETCNAWSSVDPVYGSAGVGTIDGPQTNGLDDWRRGLEPCAGANHPLLCIEVPLGAQADN